MNIEFELHFRQNMAEFQTIVFKPRSDEVIVTSNAKIPENIFPGLGFRISTLVKMSTALAGHTVMNTAPVVFLDKKKLFTPGFIAGIPQGPRREFSPMLQT